MGIKISALTPVGSLTGTEIVPLDQTGVTMSATVSQINAVLGTPITLANGGTNHALTADNGGIVYSDATKLDILAHTTTANQVLLSGSSAAPSWSTATYPTTTTINQILYSSAANTVAGLATTNSASLVTTSAGVPAWSGTLTNGQLIIGSTGATPTAGTLTAGGGITITNAAASITVATTGGGFAWTDVTGVTQAIAVNNAYVADNAGLVTLTLPATATIGDRFMIQGKGAGGWLIAQNANQAIHLGSSTTTVGAGGSLASTNQFDAISIVCVTSGASTIWSTSGVVGTITVV